VTDVVTFVSVGIIGGALIQYPLGYLSDRWDRRHVLLASTCGALVIAVILAVLASSSPLLNFVLVFFFGSFAMPLFSLSAAHANDRAGQGEFVLVNAALMLFYSFGAIVGPSAASFAMELYGPSALFGFVAVVYLIFVGIILYRMQVRGSVPAERRGRFIALLRTSTIFAKLTKNNHNGER
jgi:MFS family permease